MVKKLQLSSAYGHFGYPDGKYITRPKYAPETASRIVDIVDGRVIVKGSEFKFSQNDFFSVNIMVEPFYEFHKRLRESSQKCICISICSTVGGMLTKT